jgi:hypothetical protein
MDDQNFSVHRILYFKADKIIFRLFSKYFYQPVSAIRIHIITKKALLKY